MYSCISCQSSNLIKKGSFFNKTDNVDKQRYQCKDCDTQFSVELPKIEEEHKLYSNNTNKKYVITSYQGGEYNLAFLNVLENYCDYNNAELIILHSPSKSDNTDRILELDRHIVSDNFDIGEYITVYANLTIPKTAVNPISGLESLSKGKTLIVGHPSLQMKALQQFGDAHPIIVSSTGTISTPDYKLTSKAGAKAEHNHSYSALILEMDNVEDIFHIRVLNAEDNGNFYDLDTYYTKSEITNGHKALCLILGDTHVSVIDNDVYNATFKNKDSIVNTLKPDIIVHHDLLGMGVLQSHHNTRSFIRRYEKFVEGKDDVNQELSQTAQFLLDNCPEFTSKILIIASNHNEHLFQYIDNLENKSHDYKNSKLWHLLCYKTLDAIDNGIEVNPFKFYFDDYCKDEIKRNKIQFLGRDDNYYINDILISAHGDFGNGGSRYSPTQGRAYSTKIVNGHSHTMSINGGCYIVGTSSKKNLGYNSGSASNWTHTHLQIAKNGKRQLINIIRGKYKL